MKIEMWDLAKIHPYAKNARKIPRSAVEMVKKSIQSFGFVQPLVLDKNKTGELIIGHVRRLASLELRMKQVPCVVVDLPPEKVRQLRLMENRSHQEATFDEVLLQQELIELSEFGLEFTGFDEKQLEDLMSGIDVGGVAEDPGGESPGGKKAKKKTDQQQPEGLEFKVIVDCTGEEHQAELLAQFKTSGLTCRPLIS